MSLFDRYGRRTTKDNWFRGEETLSRQWKLYNDAIQGTDGDTISNEGWESWLARHLNTNNSYSHHEIQAAFNQRKENPRTNYLSHGKRGGVVTRTKPFVGDEALSINEWLDSQKESYYETQNANGSNYLSRMQIIKVKKDVESSQCNGRTITPSSPKFPALARMHEPVGNNEEIPHRNMTLQEYHLLCREILQPLIQIFDAETEEQPISTIMRFNKENNPVEFEAICRYKALEHWVTVCKKVNGVPKANRANMGHYSWQYNNYCDKFHDSKKQHLFTNMRMIDHTIPEPNLKLLEAHQRMVNTSYSGRKQRLAKTEQELARTQKNLDQWTNPLWVEEYVANQISTLTQQRNTKRKELDKLTDEKLDDEKIIASL